MLTSKALLYITVHETTSDIWKQTFPLAYLSLIMDLSSRIYPKACCLRPPERVDNDNYIDADGGRDESRRKNGKDLQFLNVPGKEVKREIQVFPDFPSHLFFKGSHAWKA